MSLLDNCRELVRLVREMGAADADALGIAEVGESVRVRHGQVESVERQDSRGLGLRAFVRQAGGLASASASASDMSADSLRRLAARVLEMARIAAVDRDAVPPNGAEHPSPPPTDSDMKPVWGLAAAKQAALACEAAALTHSGDITNSEGAEAGFGSSAICYAAADGFAGSYVKSHVGLSISVIAGSGDTMQRDYESAQASSCDNLAAADELGRRAAERASQRLGASGLNSRRTTVVFEPRVAIGLLGHLAGAANARAVLQQRSFLAGCTGQLIFPDWVRISDDPAHRLGLGNRPFDGEGMRTQKRNVIAGGRLTGFFSDRYAAKRLGIAATGNAKRGLAGDIGIGPHNLLWHAGSESLEAMLAEIGDGVFVTELMGFGVNAVTGDYSRGAAGFLIEGGQLARPLAGITIAGNLKDMFRNVRAAANDLTWFGTRAAPSIAIDDMTIAGQE